MPSEFRDSENFKWSISLPVGTVSRVKKESEGKFNLFTATSDCGGRELHAVLNDEDDLGEFWELLWYLVSPQADKEGITAQQFGERVRGEELTAARRAFWTEWRDFFRQLQREDMALLLEKDAKATELAHAKLSKLMGDKELSAKIDARMETEADAVMSKLHGDLLELLEPTPTAGPGDSST